MLQRPPQGHTSAQKHVPRDAVCVPTRGMRVHPRKGRYMCSQGARACVRARKGHERACKGRYTLRSLQDAAHALGRNALRVPRFVRALLCAPLSALYFTLRSSSSYGSRYLPRSIKSFLFEKRSQGNGIPKKSREEQGRTKRRSLEKEREFEALQPLSLPPSRNSDFQQKKRSREIKITVLRESPLLLRSELDAGEISQCNVRIVNRRRQTTSIGA